MTRSYYTLWYRLDGRDASLIWFSNDQDGLLTEQDGTVPSFVSDGQLRAYASAYGLVIEPHPPNLLDLDVLLRWLRTPLSSAIDCAALLNAWNLFSDLAVSVGVILEPDHQRTAGVYEKLFWGNNLPAVTPPGAHYTPEWTDEERFLLQEIMDEGLTLFRQRVRAHESAIE